MSSELGRFDSPASVIDQARAKNDAKAKVKLKTKRRASRYPVSWGGSGSPAIVMACHIK